VVFLREGERCREEGGEERGEWGGKRWEGREWEKGRG